MEKETPQLPANFHMAIIMDGNGRWAKARGLPRIDGHKAGARRIDELFEAAKEFGVRHLTLFAFSTENWSRPKIEIDALMRLFRNYVRNEMVRLLEKDVKVTFIGDKTAFSPDLSQAMQDIEAKTINHSGMCLNVAMNYGGHDEIVRAANRAAKLGEITKESLEAALDTANSPPVDLLVRTSGEARLSNFMLWQAAYAELYFTETLWPDFDREALRLALVEFGQRVRRFGGI